MTAHDMAEVISHFVPEDPECQPPLIDLAHYARIEAPNPFQLLRETRILTNPRGKLPCGGNDQKSESAIQKTIIKN